MPRRAYEISDDLIRWINTISERFEIDKSQAVEIALHFGLSSMAEIGVTNLGLKGARAIQVLLQAADEESIKKTSAKRRS